ncbi:SgrR family transcriptional regulator, partial [Escherichia coli]
TPSHEVLPGWSIPQGPANNAVPLPARLTLLYHLPVELHAMAEQLRQRLALLGCELTPLFHDAKNWEGC